MLGMSPDGVYKLIEKGKLHAFKLSERGTRISIHVLRAYQARLNGEAPPPPAMAPRDADIDTLREAFKEDTGHTPEDWVAGWKSGAIEDTPANARVLVQAVSLRKGDPSDERARERGLGGVA